MPPGRRAGRSPPPPPAGGGRVRVEELEHAVVGLAVAGVALVGLGEQPPRPRRERRFRGGHPVLVPQPLPVELGQRQQAHPRHRVRGRDPGGLLAHVPGLDPQFVRTTVTLAPRPQGAFHPDPGAHHHGRDAVRLLGEPGPHHVGPGGRGGQHLGAPRPGRPARRVLQQGAHRQPAPGAQLLQGGPQRVVGTGGVVGRPCSFACHQPSARGCRRGRSAGCSNNSPPLGG